MKKIPFLAMLLGAVMIIASCKKESADLQENNAEEKLTALNKSMNSMSDLLKSVRNATARFHSTKQAIMAGYVPNEHCVSSPSGSMGYHWANASLIDPVFDPANPEVILYAKGPGGNLRMVAVEYVVINTGQAAPIFGTQAFTVGGAPVPVPHWTLHVWLYQDNPNGMFTGFNPTVSCP